MNGAYAELTEEGVALGAGRGVTMPETMTRAASSRRPTVATAVSTAEATAEARTPVEQLRRPAPAPVPRLQAGPRRGAGDRSAPAILSELKTERAQASVDHRRTTAALADAVAGEAFDEAAARKAADDRVKSSESVQAAVARALGRIHALLQPEQRTQLAYLLRTGGRSSILVEVVGHRSSAIQRSRTHSGLFAVTIWPPGTTSRWAPGTSSVSSRLFSRGISESSSPVTTTVGHVMRRERRAGRVSEHGPEVGAIAVRSCVGCACKASGHPASSSAARGTSRAARRRRTNDGSRPRPSSAGDCPLERQPEEAHERRQVRRPHVQNPGARRDEHQPRDS